jgi:hypothetical protein
MISTLYSLSVSSHEVTTVPAEERLQNAAAKLVSCKLTATPGFQ